VQLGNIEGLGPFGQDKDVGDRLYHIVVKCLSSQLVICMNISVSQTFFCLNSPFHHCPSECINVLYTTTKRSWTVSTSFTSLILVYSRRFIKSHHHTLCEATLGLGAKRSERLTSDSPFFRVSEQRLIISRSAGFPESQRFSTVTDGTVLFPGKSRSSGEAWQRLVW